MTNTNNNNSRHLASFSDAAATLLAAISGDNEATKLMIEQLAMSDTARQDLAAALTHTLHVAATAFQYEAAAAAERGDNQSAGIEYLVAARCHAQKQSLAGAAPDTEPGEGGSDL